MIAQVFPAAATVCKNVVDRIFDDKVQQYIDFSLKDPKKRSDENLSMTEIAYSYTYDLATRLHKIVPKGTQDDIEVGFIEKVEDLFATKKKGYIETEMEVFRTAAMSEVEKAMEHGDNRVKRQEDEEDKGFIKRMMKDTDDSKMTWIRDILSPHTYEVKDPETGQSRRQQWDLCDRLIKRCTTSLRRCEKLANPTVM